MGYNHENPTFTSFWKNRKKIKKIFIGLNDAKINSKTKMSSNIFLFEAIFADFLPLFKKNWLHAKIWIFSFFFCFQHQHWKKLKSNTFKQLILHMHTVLKCSSTINQHKILFFCPKLFILRSFLSKKNKSKNIKNSQNRL